ncbi:hypothetical protein ACHAWF_016721 [Thalassiosira exigua]
MKNGGSGGGGKGTVPVLCLCAFAHTYLLFSVLPYSGYFSLFLLGGDGGSDEGEGKGGSGPSGLSVDTIGIYSGLLGSAFSLGRLVGFSPWKKIRSTYGEKRSLIASLVLSAIFSATFGASTTYSAALLSRFASGLSNGTSGAIKRVAIDRAKARTASEDVQTREEAEEWILSRVLVVMSFGCASAPAVSGLLSSDADDPSGYPYLMPNAFGAGMSVTSAVLVALIVEDDHKKDALRANGSSGEGESKPLLSIANAKGAAPRPLSAIWKTSSTRWHILAYIAFSFCIACVDEALPLYLIARIGGPGWSVPQVGLLLGVTGFIGALLQLVIHGKVLMESIGLYPTLHLSSVLANVPLVILPISLLLGNRASFVFMVFILGVAFYFGYVYFGLIGIATSRTVPIMYKDDASRIMTLLALAARAVAPTVSGLVLTILSGHPWGVWIVIGLGFGTVAAALTFALWETAAAGWGKSEFLERRSVYLSQRQRARVYTRLWEVHYDRGSQSAPAKWRRLVRKVIAVNRLSGTARSKQESGGRPKNEPKKRASWSNRQIRPGLDVDDVPFIILGTHKTDEKCMPHVLTPPLMEALRVHLPGAVRDANFWLKYSLVRDGSNLTALASKAGLSKYTILAIETLDGDVFGCFMAVPWERRSRYSFCGQSFLWRLKKPRSTKSLKSPDEEASAEEDVEIFNWSGENEFCQLFANDKIAVGGDQMTGSKGAGFGLVIGDALERGSSSPCKTYSNRCLVSDSESGEFEVANIEIWALTPFWFEADAERSERSRRLMKENMMSEGETPSSQSEWSRFL